MLIIYRIFIYFHITHYSNYGIGQGQKRIPELNKERKGLSLSVRPLPSAPALHNSCGITKECALGVGSLLDAPKGGKGDVATPPKEAV